MISEYKKTDTSKILNIVNDASIKYKDVIPDDCWKEPYMSEQELIDEFNDGVRIYGYNHNNELIGFNYRCNIFVNVGSGSTLIMYWSQVRVLAGPPPNLSL